MSPVHLPRSLQPAGVVESDRRCITCGYALRGLPMSGRCPECGTSVRVPASIDDPISNMPPDVVRLFRAGAWIGSITLTLMIGSVIMPSVARVPAWLAPAIFTALSPLWLTAVTMLTPVVELPAAARHGFSRRGRLRIAARAGQIGWIAAGSVATLQSVSTNPPTGVAAASDIVLAGAVVVGMIGIILLSIVLARLAQWARDDTAERAFSVVVWGVVPAFALGFVNVPFGVLVWQLLVRGLQLVTLIAFPFALWSLCRSIHYAVIHAEDHQDREERRRERQARDARRAGQAVRKADAAKRRERPSD